MKSSFAKGMEDETGYSAVRLAHLLWEQGVAGSNPATPTSQKALQCVSIAGLFSLERHSKTAFSNDVPMKKARKRP